MPCLKSAIRKHHIGSDDLTVPAAIESVSYIVWLVWFVKRPSIDAACFHEHALLRNFNCIGLFLMGSGFFLSLQILQTSLKGTVINTTPRQCMGVLILAKLVLDVITFGIIFFSTTTFLLCDFPACDPVALRTVKLHIGASWGVAFVISINIWHWTFPPRRVLDWVFLDFLGSIVPAEKKQSLWRRFGFDDHSVLNGVVDLLMNFFKERVDIVPTDLLVSLILLEKEQVRSLSSSFCARPSAEASSRLPWMNVGLARHYLRFATGSFGWPMYLFSGWFAVPWLISYILKNGIPAKENLDHVVGDNKWLTNTLVIQMLTGLSLEEIVYVSFRNKMFEVPFFIAIDQRQKSIVVSVRGSLSVHDVLTDLTAHESEQFSFDDTTALSAHFGMLTTTKKLQCKLLGTDDSGLVIEDGLLLKANAKLKNLVGEASASEYKLVITGHSLGAGVAAILSILLYQREEYQNLQCFAFAPPGGLLSLSAAAYSEKFVFCVVLGDDLVARLGVYTVFDLKYKVLKMLQNCDIPKHTIVGGWLQEKLIALLGMQAERMDGTWTQRSSSWANDENAARAVASYQKHLQDAINSTLTERDKHSRLYLPGCVLYIKESADSCWFLRRKKTYTPNWCSCEAEIFAEVILSPNLVHHHSPRSAPGTRFPSMKRPDNKNRLPTRTIRSLVSRSAPVLVMIVLVNLLGFIALRLNFVGVTLLKPCLNRCNL